jgi:hypothetical protein
MNHLTVLAFASSACPSVGMAMLRSQDEDDQGDDKQNPPTVRMTLERHVLRDWALIRGGAHGFELHF